MNEHGIVMWYGFLSSTSTDELKPHLERLLQRHQTAHCDPTWTPATVYIDNCCELRDRLHAILGNHVPICLDPKHWFDRWDEAIAAKPNSPTHLCFNSELRDAMFTWDTEDYEREKARLTKPGHPKPRHADIIKACRRVILQPHKLVPALNAVVDKWVQRDRRTLAAKAAAACVGSESNSVDPTNTLGTVVSFTWTPPPHSHGMRCQIHINRFNDLITVQVPHDWDGESSYQITHTVYLPSPAPAPGAPPIQTFVSEALV